jgi:hypothetical protein
MSQYVRNKTELLAMSINIRLDESKDFTVPWAITKADACTLQLQLAGQKSGCVWKVEVTGPKQVRVSALEASKKFTITGLNPVDVRAMDWPLRTRRI